MKKFIDVRHALISIDTDTADVGYVNNCNTAIDWMYIAPCDGVLKDGTVVKKGQVIIKLYGNEDSGLSSNLILLQDEAFTDHIVKYNEALQNRRKEPCDSCNETCCRPA